jgi:carboxypeptidase Taq
MGGEELHARFRALWGVIRDLESAQQLLEWDQETYMPVGGAAARGRVLATLAGLRHDRLTTPELAETVGLLAETEPGEGEWGAQAREARRQLRRAAAVPRRLAEEIAAASSAGLAAWQEARPRRDFAILAPSLDRLLALKREEAACLAEGGQPYDAMLDLYEPGATAAELAPLFAALRARLVPLVRAVVASGRAVDEAVVRGTYPREAQRELGAWVAAQIGFDFTAGRLDLSAHPFCMGIDRRDVRLTWRADEQDFRPGLMGVLHEMGHGLYDQGLPEEWQGTPLGEAASVGVHESQSRLWEILVGRGRAFWRWLHPHFRRAFPGQGPAVSELWGVLHAIRPSLIRVEADEATYNLHVLVRFELERALFDGSLSLADLPAAWDDAYEATLGLRPAHHGEGVLQDLHWPAGYFGYFPTYTLGTLAAVQLHHAAERALGGLEEALAAGDFAGLLGWLREHVHRHGSRLPPAELVARAAGGPLSAEPFLAHVEAVARELYGVAASSSAAGR